MSDICDVTLDDHEIWSATCTGLMRAWQARILKSTERLSFVSWPENVRLHIIGAIGEMGAAKYLNAFTIPSFNVWKKEPDISVNGFNIEVRTRTSSTYDLIVRDDDKDDSIYVLAIYENNKLTLNGWIKGAQGKKNEYVQEYGGNSKAFFVPQDKLFSMELLKTLINGITYSNLNKNFH